MSYTHYFRTHKDGIPVPLWKKICDDTRKLLSNLPEHSASAGGAYSESLLKIAFEQDEPNMPPEVSEGMIRFNGTGEQDLGHETFYFERVPSEDFLSMREDNTLFSFCKTARKPYDLVVCGVLLVINRHAYKHVIVSSDGNRADWLPAVEWVQQTLGEFYPLPTAVWADVDGLRDPNATDASVDFDGKMSLHVEHGDVPMQDARSEAGTEELSGLQRFVHTDVPDAQSANPGTTDEDELPQLCSRLPEEGENYEDALSGVRQRGFTDAPPRLQPAAIDSLAVPSVPHEPAPEPITTSHTFLVDTREFREALELAVAAKQATIPVITNVLLSPQGSTLRILSTDLDQWSITEVPSMISDGAGDVLLPHRKAMELLKGETGLLKITSTVTTLSDKFLSAWVKLSVNDCEYDLPSKDPAHFPAHRDIPLLGFEVSATDLKGAIGRVIGCISNVESRYTLNGALLQSKTKGLLLVATDGHRMALDSIPMHGMAPGNAIISRSSLAWLSKHGTGTVAFALGDEFSFFRFADTTLITRNVPGKFPNWQAVVPKKTSFEHVATFPSGDEFAKTLSKVARMADERSGAVKITLNGSCVLSASSTDEGKASATVTATVNHFTGDEVTVGFNSSFILDVLKIAGKNPVVLSMKDSQNAGVFTIPSLLDYKHILMPMRV